MRSVLKRLSGSQSGENLTGIGQGSGRTLAYSTRDRLQRERIAGTILRQDGLDAHYFEELYTFVIGLARELVGNDVVLSAIPLVYARSPSAIVDYAEVHLPDKLNVVCNHACGVTSGGLQIGAEAVTVVRKVVTISAATTDYKKQQSRTCQHEDAKPLSPD